jgi:hypothetical protein
MQIDAPPSLVNEHGPGAGELRRARKHYLGGGEGSLTFSAYKGADVKDALEKLFQDKCAYCEAQYSFSSPFDVEHFRPKAAIAGEPDSRGYWWLAMKWDNLLPSCPDCNRERYHVIVEEGMTMEQALLTKLSSMSGKGESFPVASERAIDETSNLDDEEALLINPCDCDPAVHLRFTTDADLSLVVPRDKEKGSASVQVYGLNRLKLVQGRTLLLLELRTMREELSRYVTNAENCALRGDDMSRAQWLDEAMRKLEQLRAKAEVHQPFSAMASAFFKLVQDDMNAFSI